MKKEKQTKKMMNKGDDGQCQIFSLFRLQVLVPPAIEQRKKLLRVRVYELDELCRMDKNNPICMMMIVMLRAYVVLFGHLDSLVLSHHHQLFCYSFISLSFLCPLFCYGFLSPFYPLFSLSGSSLLFSLLSASLFSSHTHRHQPSL